MRIYLVDYENVGEYGIRGIGNLNEGDQVHVFYSEQIKTIPFERCVEMAKSKATIDFISTHKTAKNYLDFQLSMYLGYLVGKGTQGTYYVVSKDTGFNSIVDFGKTMGLNVSRCACIDPEENRKSEQQKIIDNQNSLRNKKNKKRHKNNNNNAQNTNPVETVLNAETKTLKDVTTEVKTEQNDKIEVRTFKAQEKTQAVQAPKVEANKPEETKTPAVQKEVKKDLVPQKETAKAKQPEKAQEKTQAVQAPKEKQVSKKTASKKKEEAKPVEKKAEPAKKSTGKKQELPESVREKVRAAVKAHNLPPSSYSVIYRVMVESGDKLALNNALVKAFTSARGGQLYSCIKPIFKEYKKLK